MRYGDFTHEQAFTHTSLGQLLMASNFKSVQSFEDRPVVHGLKNAVCAALCVCLRVGLLFYIAVETGALDHLAVFSQNLLAVAYLDETGE